MDEALWGEGSVGGGLTEIEGNAHPAYFRLTCGAIPDTQSLKSRWHLPLGAVVQPLAPAPAGVSGETNFEAPHKYACWSEWRNSRRNPEHGGFPAEAL